MLGALKCTIHGAGKKDSFIFAQRHGLYVNVGYTLMGRLITIILIFSTVLCSCKFYTPLVKFHDRSFDKVDSVNKTTLKIDSYKYPRISWLSGPHWTGAYVLNSFYDQNNHLTKKVYSWRSNSSLTDGNLKTKTKIVYYSDSLTIVKIDYMIDKNHGPGRMPVFRKTVIWDEKKKKYLEVNSAN